MLSQFEVEAKRAVGVQLSVSGNLFISVGRCRISGSKVSPLAGRQEIKSFSKSSAARMRKYLRECSSQYAYMVTLTYPSVMPVSGRATKEHLRRFLQELRRYSGRRKQLDTSWSVLWFLEFQDRGAVHYHLLTTHTFGKEFISECWYQICGTELAIHKKCGTRIEKLRTGRAGIASYAAKYAVKTSQKQVPEGFDNVGRFWGVSGCKKVVSASTFISRESTELGAVIRLKSKIKECLTAGMDKGTITRLESKGGASVFTLSTASDQRALILLVHRLNSMIAANSGVGRMFLLGEDANGGDVCP